MDTEQLEAEIGAHLERVAPNRRVDLYGILPASITYELRGKVIALCGAAVVVEDTLAAAERRAKGNGWKGIVRFIPGPPTSDMSLQELEGTA